MYGPRNELVICNFKFAEKHAQVAWQLKASRQAVFQSSTARNPFPRQITVSGIAGDLVSPQIWLELALMIQPTHTPRRFPSYHFSHSTSQTPHVDSTIEIRALEPSSLDFPSKSSKLLFRSDI